MTYTVLAVLLFLLLSAAAFLPCSRFYHEKKYFRIAVSADAVMTLAGIIIMLVSHLVISEKIFSVGDSTFESWALDMLNGWYSLILPASAILIGISAAAAFTISASDGKRNFGNIFLRSAVLAASEAVPLILAPFYGFMTDNSFVPLYSAILVSGTGFALAFRLAGLAGHMIYRKIQAKK